MSIKKTLAYTFEVKLSLHVHADGLITFHRFKGLFSRRRGPGLPITPFAIAGVLSLGIDGLEFVSSESTGFTFDEVQAAMIELPESSRTASTDVHRIVFHGRDMV